MLHAASGGRNSKRAVSARGAVPSGFAAVHAIRGGVDAVLKGDVVEDVELVLRPPAAFIGHADLLPIFLGAPGDVARITREGQLGVGFVGRADKAQRRRIPERIAKGRGQIGQQHPIAGFDGFQAHRRAVEPDAVAHQLRVELARGHGDVMPAAMPIAELEIDHLEVVIAHIFLDFFQGCLAVSDYRHTLAMAGSSIGRVSR